MEWSHKPDGTLRDPFCEAKDMKLRHKAIVPTLAALVVGPILICLPYALSRALTTRLARWLG